MPHTFKLAHRLARLRRLAFLAAAPALMLACSNDPSDPLGNSQSNVATVDVTPSDLTENVGETAQFVAVVRDPQGRLLTNRAVNWTTSDTTIAKITGTGIGTAVNVGYVRVTATVGGKSGVANTTVKHPIAGFAPGAVTDLAITSTTDTSVTMSFTETGNGAGGAASYLLRYAASPMNWTNAGSTTKGTCGTPIPGTTQGARRTCTVSGLSPATAYDFQLRAFRQASVQDTVFGALSNVGKGVTASAAVTIGWPNEPGGLSELSNQPFDALEGLGWHVTANPAGNMFIGSDPTAPQSPSKVLQFNYPSGFTGSVAPGTLYFPHAAAKEVYAGFYWKPSSPWQNHPTNVNKVAFWLTETSGSSLDLQMYGPAPYYMHVVTQFPGGTYRLPPNVTATPIELGKWHRIEWHVKYATSGNNGVVEWWIDGVLQGRYTNVQTPNDRGFIEYQFSPTWGGTGGLKTENDYYMYDHLKLSHR